MAEKTKADIYIAYLDQILAGKKNIGPVADVEIENLLLLAKTLITNDLSINSKIKESLRKRLLSQLTKGTESSSSVLLSNDDELDEDTLDYVASGFAGQAGEQMDSCPYCRSRFQTIDGKCSLCNH